MKGIDGSGFGQSLEYTVNDLRHEIVFVQKALAEIGVIQAPLLGTQQVAKALGKSPDTISRWVKDRVISCYKVPNGKGYTYLFSWKQLEEDLSDYAQPRL